MSKVTLMAGSSQSLCRAWHALQEMEHNRSTAHTGKKSHLRKPVKSTNRHEL